MTVIGQLDVDLAKDKATVASMAYGRLHRALTQTQVMPNPLQFRGRCTCTRENLECSSSQLGQVSRASRLVLVTRL